MFFKNEKEYNEAVERYNALPQVKKEEIIKEESMKIMKNSLYGGYIPENLK